MLRRVRLKIYFDDDPPQIMLLAPGDEDTNSRTDVL